MGNRDLLGLVLANLNRMRARVALTAIGVVIGTAAVVLLVSLSVGLQRNLSGQLGGTFGDVSVINVSPRSTGEITPRGAAARDLVRLDEEALEAMANLPGVVAVTPNVSLRGGLELRVGRDETFAPFVQGVDPRAAEDLGWALQSGRLRLGGGQVVVGPDLFEGNAFVMVAPGSGAVVESGRDGAGPTSLQGRTITAVLTRVDEEGETVTRSERLRVAGVFEPSGGVNDISLYMSLADIEAFNQWLTGERRGPRDGYESAIVKADAPESVREVQAAIDDMGLSTFSSQQIAEGLGQLFLVVRLVLGGVGAVALLVAAFGIANTMTMAIYERTKEIGIMKAVGATNRDVLRIFLAEAGAIGALGGLFGVLVGWLAGKGGNLALQLLVLRNQAGAAASDEELPTLLVTPLWLAAFALGFATLVGLASGVYPALRAASMKPLRALRTD